ncbi:glycosyltransferase family 2 protein [Bradyrhizobium sp. LLZ17]|uniref:Glycosyltransferase family 2 protein n=1 Tax=Bradyrhizobium sp. LLZ17 TaxID=3239388 RepID=A0AB39XSB3_9BRAD
MNLVSIVIPAYNAERFIARTLASAQAQTYEKLEIIVIDDGSTDNTRSVVEAIAATDKRLELISTPNRGVARARNLGIENARGPYVAFLDADDLWHPTKIARQVEALDTHRSDPSWGWRLFLSPHHKRGGPSNRHRSDLSRLSRLYPGARPRAQVHRKRKQSVGPSRCRDGR